MKLIINFFLIISCIISLFLHGKDFTIASYNCGGLSNHYDYLRAVVMQKVMQERYLAEPENMAVCDRIQQLALRILFAPDSESKAAQKEWKRKNYEKLSAQLTASPMAANSQSTLV